MIESELKDMNLYRITWKKNKKTNNDASYFFSNSAFFVKFKPRSYQPQDHHNFSLSLSV